MKYIMTYITVFILLISPLIIALGWFDTWDRQDVVIAIILIEFASIVLTVISDDTKFK